jgi:hypothetical protein
VWERKTCFVTPKNAAGALSFRVNTGFSSPKCYKLLSLKHTMTCSLFATQASQLVKLIEAFEKEEQDEKKAERMKKLEIIVGVKLLEQQIDACSSSGVEKDTAMIKPRFTARKRQRIYSTDDEADRDEPPPPGSDVVEDR